MFSCQIPTKDARFPRKVPDFQKRCQISKKGARFTPKGVRFTPKLTQNKKVPDLHQKGARFTPKGARISFHPLNFLNIYRKLKPHYIEETMGSILSIKRLRL